MAGDHKQLDATVKSDEASRKGLSLSLFERVMRYEQTVSKMLNEQYRMNSLIMDWSSHAMYEDSLIAHKSVKDRTMSDIITPSSMALDLGLAQSAQEVLSSPLMFIDTAGSLMHEGIDEESKNESKYNNGECDIVIQVLKELISYGVRKADIGVITPYSAQVNLIKKQIRHNPELHHQPSITEGVSSGKLLHIEVSTVDGFQGREKEIIIISMVRSNP